MNAVILICGSSDEHQVRQLVGLEEINGFLHISIFKGSVKFLEINISNLSSSLDINTVDMDASCCFLNTFLFLDVGLVFKNV